MSRRRVLLPLPDGPTITASSPSGIFRLTRSVPILDRPASLPPQSFDSSPENRRRHSSSRFPLIAFNYF